MNRVTGYKCVFGSKAQSWKFALTLAEEPGAAEFAVTDADSAETLLDMFDDATEVHFDAATADVTFIFGFVEMDDEEESEEDGDETAGEAEEEDAARNAA